MNVNMECKCACPANYYGTNCENHAGPSSKGETKDQSQNTPQYHLSTNPSSNAAHNPMALNIVACSAIDSCLFKVFNGYLFTIVLTQDRYSMQIFDKYLRKTGDIFFAENELFTFKVIDFDVKSESSVIAIVSDVAEPSKIYMLQMSENSSLVLIDDPCAEFKRNSSFHELITITCDGDIIVSCPTDPISIIAFDFEGHASRLTQINEKDHLAVSLSSFTDLFWIQTTRGQIYAYDLDHLQCLINITTGLSTPLVQGSFWLDIYGNIVISNSNGAGIDIWSTDNKEVFRAYFGSFDDCGSIGIIDNILIISCYDSNGVYLVSYDYA